VAGGLAEEARTIVTRVLRTADMAVTETRCDDPIPGLSQPIHREDAYLVALTLRDFPNRKYWQDGRQMPVCNLRIGQVDLHDLKRDPIALLDQPYHDLFFYIPRNASSGVWPIAELFFTRVSAQLGSTASHLAPPASHRGG
jgi:hypothetical protein